MGRPINGILEAIDSPKAREVLAEYREFLKGLPENKIPNKKIEKCFFEKVIIFV
jgi:hypothetical protein